MSQHKRSKSQQVQAQTDAQVAPMEVQVKAKLADVEALQQGSLIEHRKDELAMKERIEMAKLETKMAIERYKVDHKYDKPQEEAA